MEVSPPLPSLSFVLLAPSRTSRWHLPIAYQKETKLIAVQGSKSAIQSIISITILYYIILYYYYYYYYYYYIIIILAICIMANTLRLFLSHGGLVFY